MGASLHGKKGLTEQRKLASHCKEEGEATPRLSNCQPAWKVSHDQRARRGANQQHKAQVPPRGKEEVIEKPIFDPL
eukprot:6270800-Amphidinium_carterae.2